MRTESSWIHVSRPVSSMRCSGPFSEAWASIERWALSLRFTGAWVIVILPVVMRATSTRSSMSRVRLWSWRRTERRAICAVSSLKASATLPANPVQLIGRRTEKSPLLRDPSAVRRATWSTSSLADAGRIAIYWAPPEGRETRATRARNEQVMCRHLSATARGKCPECRRSTRGEGERVRSNSVIASRSEKPEHGVWQLCARGTARFHSCQEREADDEEAPDGKDARALIAPCRVRDPAEDEGADHRRALAAQRVETKELRLHALGAQAREEGATRRLHRSEPGAGHHCKDPELCRRLHEVGGDDHRRPLDEGDHHHALGAEVVDGLGPGERAAEGGDLDDDVEDNEPLHGKAQGLRGEDRGEGDHGVHAVLVEEVGAHEAAQIPESEDAARGGQDLGHAVTRRLPHAEATGSGLGQDDEGGQREHREEHRRAEEGASICLRAHEGERSEECDDGARVADGEAPRRDATLMRPRGEIGEIGVVIHEGALVADVAQHAQEEAPHHHAWLHGFYEGGGDHREEGEADEERPPDARAIGHSAEEGRADGDHGHGDGDHAAPPEIAGARSIAHHAHGVVRGIDGGEHHRREGGIREIIEGPGRDGADVHEADPASTGSGTRCSSAWNSAMISRRRARRWPRRSRSRSTAMSPRASRRTCSTRAVHDRAKNPVGRSESRKATIRRPPATCHKPQPSRAQHTG